MQFCRWQFQQRAGGAVGVGGGMDMAGGIVGTCEASSVLSSDVSSWLSWLVGIQLRHDVLARMEGDPSHRVDLGVAWKGKVDG